MSIFLVQAGRKPKADIEDSDNEAEKAEPTKKGAAKETTKRSNNKKASVADEAEPGASKAEADVESEPAPAPDAGSSRGKRDRAGNSKAATKAKEVAPTTEEKLPAKRAARAKSKKVADDSDSDESSAEGSFSDESSGEVRHFIYFGPRKTTQTLSFRFFHYFSLLPREQRSLVLQRRQQLQRRPEKRRRQPRRFAESLLMFHTQLVA